MEEEFNASKELAEIKKVRQVMRKRRIWEKSRLVKFRGELLALAENGASLEDIRIWLRKSKRVCIDRSNIMRFLKKATAEQGV